MNLLEYLRYERAPFSERPFNPVDSAALSQFCMVRAEGIVPPPRALPRFGALGRAARRVASAFEQPVRFGDLARADQDDRLFTGLVPGHIRETLHALATSPRFRDARLHSAVSVFDEQRHTQFAAITVQLSRTFAYVGFRGTDASITGWREDFNMACAAPVPAQQQAADYLNLVAAQLPRACRIVVGGHSKGGNLAVYAALRANPAVRARIERVYSHDGPGFKAGLFAPQEWDALAGRIHHTVPQESVVGMLMDMPVPARVVRSADHGINQHSVFLWEVADDDFAYVDALAEPAQRTADVIAEWLGRYSDAEVARIVDALFRAIETSGARDAFAVFAGGAATWKLVAEAAAHLDGDDRATLMAALGSLAEVVARHVGRTVADALPWRGGRAEGRRASS